MAGYHYWLVLALFTLSASADVFTSIDCGSSDFYTDENLIVWSGDDNYIQNGESMTVQSTNSISPVLDTLRVFTSRKKNCYAIDSIKHGRVLVRASFFYGNYDGKNAPPTFDLQFDGNYWATVETSSTLYSYYEAIYVAKGDSISVCVAQTKPDQYPFISALEVRGLLPHMYNYIDENYPLFLTKRVAYGANVTVRYADDPYDRIWTPAVVTGLAKVSSDVIFSAPVVGDLPPAAVLQNAVTASSSSGSLQVVMGLPEVEVPVYLNWYFAEVTQLASDQKRSFWIFKDDKPSSNEAIIPPYGNYTQYYDSNLTVSSKTKFDLVPANDSTLPPLINALEVFLVGDRLTDGTNSKDVEGLALLQNQFNDLQDWSGDPCLPSPYTWDWLNCSSDATPRVTALYLDSYNLAGTLPDFSSMDGLEIIDLHNNSLIGVIPDFLGELPNLKELNLADNQLSGAVPASLSQKNGLKLEITGNPDLCTSGSSCTSNDSPGSPTKPAKRASRNTKKKNNKLPVILGSTIPSFFAVWGVLGAFLIVSQKRKAAAAAAARSAGQGGAKMQQGPDRSPQSDWDLMNDFRDNIEEHVHVELSDQTTRPDHENERKDRDLYNVT